MASSQPQQKVRFSIDRGGTFTDIYAEVRRSVRLADDVPGGGVIEVWSLRGLTRCVCVRVGAKVPGEKGYRLLKLLSVDPQNYSDAPREGIRRILEEVCMPAIVPQEIVPLTRGGFHPAGHGHFDPQGPRAHGPHRMGAYGHHGGNQRTAGAQGQTDRPRDHPRVSGSAADRYALSFFLLSVSEGRGCRE